MTVLNPDIEPHVAIKEKMWKASLVFKRRCV